MALIVFRLRIVTYIWSSSLSKESDLGFKMLGVIIPSIVLGEISNALSLHLAPTVKDWRSSSKVAATVCVPLMPAYVQFR